MDFAGNIRDDLKTIDAKLLTENLFVTENLSDIKTDIYKIFSTGILCEDENRCVKLLEFEGENIIGVDVALLNYFKGCELYTTSSEGLVLAYKGDRLQGFCMPMRIKYVKELIAKNLNILEKTS